MHRKNMFLREVLPAWFSIAGLGLLFAMIFISLTREYLPQQILRLLQSISSHGAARAGMPFGEMLATTFLLYGMLGMCAGLLMGIVVNHLARLIWHFDVS